MSQSSGNTCIKLYNPSAQLYPSYIWNYLKFPNYLKRKNDLDSIEIIFNIIYCTKGVVKSKFSIFHGPLVSSANWWLRRGVRKQSGGLGGDTAQLNGEPLFCKETCIPVSHWSYLRKAEKPGFL